MEYKLIALTKQDGTVVGNTVVDADDYEALMEWYWRFGAGGYALRQERRDGHPTSIYVHRLVMGVEPHEKVQVDHINRNKLDNRKTNLRVVDHQGNGQNVGSTKGSSSQYRGVGFDRQAGKWRAWAKVEGRCHHLGCFTDELEAAEVAREFRLANMPFAVD